MISNYQSSETIFYAMILSSASPLLVMSALAILALKYNPPASLDPFLLSMLLLP